MAQYRSNDITSGYRPIQDGKQFERFFGQPDQKDRIIIEDGEVNETVDLMKKVVWKYLDDTKQISGYLKGSTIEKTAENIWNFLYHHIQYKLDKKGVEQLRRPNRSWYERNSGIDCDCFSIFVSSILTNLQIQHSFRIARYDENYFQHVYIVIPRPTKEYLTIDCVLSQYNFEKQFTDKKDFTMNLNGINIAVLSGVESTNVLSLTDDIENIGSADDSERLFAIYNHLVKTRDLVKSNPKTVINVDYAPALIKMLDYAIEFWHTPSRDSKIQILEMNERAYNELKGISEIDDDYEEDWGNIEGFSDDEILYELSGLDGKTKKPKPVKAVKKKFFTKVNEAIKKGGKAFVKYNPVSVTARNGFLLALRLNLKQMASKLKWAYATKEQAAAKGVSLVQWQRAKTALDKIEKLFADKLQGKKDKLRDAILKGKAGGLNGFESEFPIDQLGVVVAATTITAALPVIAMALKILVDSGLMSKKEAENIEKEAKEKSASAEIELNDKTLFEPEPNNKSIQIPRNSDTQDSISQTNLREESNDLENENKGENKFISFVKQNPILVAAGTGALILGANFLLKPKNKSNLKGVKIIPSKKTNKNVKKKKIQVVHLK